jgi:hypothetical protein
MLRRVALGRTDVSEKRSVSFIRVTNIGELGTTLAVISNRRTLRINTMALVFLFVFLRSVRRLLLRASLIHSSHILVTLMKEALSSSEPSVLTRATRRNIPEDNILHSHCRENLRSYMHFNWFYTSDFFSGSQNLPHVKVLVSLCPIPIRLKCYDCIRLSCGQIFIDADTHHEFHVSGFLNIFS